jgi:hypothetical protein
VVPSKRVGAAETFLLRAHIAPDLLLPCVMDGVLVSGEVVGPREHRAARLASSRVDALALVRSRLRVQEGGRYRPGPAQTIEAIGSSMELMFVFSQQIWRFEYHRTTVVRACICPAACAN